MRSFLITSSFLMFAAHSLSTPQAGMRCDLIKILSFWNQTDFPHDRREERWYRAPGSDQFRRAGTDDPEAATFLFFFILRPGSRGKRQRVCSVSAATIRR